MTDDGPDRNVTAYRPDVAAAHLRGIMTAERYADGVRRQVWRGRAPVRERPAATARQVTELLMGEIFTVYDENAGWTWGQCAHDDYVGYVRADALDADVIAASHKVAALRALILPQPDLKTPPLDSVSLGARVAVVGHDGAYARLAGGGWLATVALAPLDAVAPDVTATALRFVGVPYLWGGRTSLGLDCSGLVQIVLAEAGIAAPRDSHMQETAVGDPVAIDGPLGRGDLVFLPGHVGFMVDDAVLVHANATAMCVSCDPVRDVAKRVRRAEGRGITAVRRFSGP